MRSPRDRPLLVPIILALVVVGICLLLYRFANYREERAVKQFLEALKSGDYAKAYQLWGPTPTYTYEDLLSDWGEKGYYGKVKGYRILEANTKGSGVIVYVEFNHLKTPLAFWVERKTRTLSFSPIFEYKP